MHDRLMFRNKQRPTLVPSSMRAEQFKKDRAKRWIDQSIVQMEHIEHHTGALEDLESLGIALLPVGPRTLYC